jgi:tRNA/tmRNA/rRNA uracil-C5-methylase (TrmA/RlmC/RlmD family)
MMPSYSVGGKIKLRIDDVAFGGEGVGRLDDFVVFVPFTAVGDVVQAELTEVKKKFGRAKLLQVLEPSSLRVEPRCRYFGDCGGCQYQHMDYPEQLRVKRKQIADLFQRVGGFDPGVVAPVTPCPRAYGYRNRIMIRSQWDKFKQGLNIGFIRNDNRLVVDIQECAIADPALNHQIQQVRANPPPKGGIKVVLRVPPEGWDVPPDSFFQNNFHLLPRLVDVVRSQVQSSGTRHLIDVYCGVGFFSVELAGIVDSFAGIELDRLAIEAARKNAARRRIGNGEFIAGTAEEKLPEIITRFKPSVTTVLLDPPRKGCAASLIELLRETRPAQVIYVSCNPATMARDLNILCADNVFDLAQVVPLDMFPQTSHVESVADLRCNTFV